MKISRDTLKTLGVAAVTMGAVVAPSVALTPLDCPAPLVSPDRRLVEELPATPRADAWERILAQPQTRRPGVRRLQNLIPATPPQPVPTLEPVQPPRHRDPCPACGMG